MSSNITKTNPSISSTQITETYQKFFAFNFEITTTPSCNMNCSYCFEGKKATDKNIVNKRLPDIINKVDDILQSAWFIEEYTHLNLDFWGGEPTLNNTIIIDLIEHYKNNDKVVYHLYTNGYAIKDIKEIIDATDCRKLSIQVSYDGEVINDRFRLTYDKKSTTNKVLDTFDWLSKQDIALLSLKSTLPLTEVKSMYVTWLEFRDLYIKYKDIDIVYIKYAPTIDYHSKITDSNKYIGAFQKNIRQIAKEELIFYKEMNEFLFSWFGAAEEKAMCTAGKNIVILDEDSNIYPCHGILYLKDKIDHSMGNLFDNNTDSINTKRTQFKTMIERTDEICKSCVATTCLVCPAASLENSDRETFSDKWTHHQIHGLCAYYQDFGKIDRSVLKILGGK